MKIKENILSGVRRLGIALYAALATGLLLAGPSHATGGVDVSAATGGFDGLKSAVTSGLGPALVGLVLVIIGVIMGIRWLRKGASQS